jgi:hypothetical protein
MLNMVVRKLTGRLEQVNGTAFLIAEGVRNQLGCFDGAKYEDIFIQ